MRKSQLVIVLFAVVLTSILFSLPNVIVSDKVLDAKASGTSSSPTAPDTSSAVSSTVHNTTLAPEQLAALDQLRKNYVRAVEKEKKLKFADSLAALFGTYGRLDSAAYYREKGVEVAPSFTTWLAAGDAYYQAFDFAADTQKAGSLGEKARGYFEKVLAQQPDRLDVKAKLAMTYVTTSNPMQGITMLREVVQQDPKNELALFNLGRLAIMSTQYDKAVDRFKHVLELNPANTQAQFYLGVCYAETGRKTEAKELFESLKKVEKNAIIQASIDEYLKNLN